MRRLRVIWIFIGEREREREREREEIKPVCDLPLIIFCCILELHAGI
jgi:hypothetical protein